MTRRFIIRVIILLFSIISHIHSQDTDVSIIHDKIRAAFVFAGSARSFVTSFVRLTIRKNIILAFCPPETCIPDVFVRVSSNDNNHGGTDSVGNLTVGTPELKNQIDNCLKTIEPSQESGGKLYRVFSEVGSEQEKAEMRVFGKDNVYHKIYRELDPRRYSMFFNRLMAFQMMTNAEKTSGNIYTWVLHVRLDCGWGEPIKPHYLWQQDKFYMPDTWHADLPDTFAIIPRNLSEMYYSIDDFFHPKGICLGGPNLDVRTLERESLLKRGYNDTEIAIVQAEDCIFKFKDYPTERDPISLQPWSTSGVSEYLLKRKLESRGYEIGKGNVVLHPFFVFIVRFPLEPACFYLAPKYLISWAKVTNIPVAAFYPVCHLLNHDLKAFEPYVPSTNTCKVSDIGPGYDLAKHRAVAAQDSCILHEEFSDLNFMPFRLRLRHNCITTEREPPMVNMSACVNFKRYRFMQSYINEQLFHFYPLIKTPQKIYQYTVVPPIELKQCLSVSVRSMFPELPSLSTASSYSFPVRMDHCSHPKDPNQDFVIHILDNNKVISKNKVRGHYDVKANLKPLSIIKITWTWHIPNTKDKYTYCLFSPDVNATSSSLLVRDCSKNREMKLSISNSGNTNNMNTFLLERTTSSGLPYKSGLKIGRQPSFSVPDEIWGWEDVSFVH